MSDEVTRILRGLESLGHKVDGVRVEVHRLDSTHGQRIAALESSLPERIRADLATALASEREAWRRAMSAALAAEREEWQQRITKLEQHRDHQRGAAWAMGVVWTLIASLPGVIALWLGWSRSS